MSKLVSAVIPTFNRGWELRRAVESVTAQTYRPLELVVVDDGSTDETPEAIRVLCEEARAKGLQVQALRQTNAGAGAARNTGARAAGGDYIAFLDDDDRWYPPKIAMQVAETERAGADLCSCIIERISPDGSKSRTYPKNSDRLLRGRNPSAVVSGELTAHTNSLFFTKELFERVGPMREDLRNKEDHEWIIRAAHHALMCSVPEVLGTYEYRPGSLVSSQSWQKQLAKNDCTWRCMEYIREACSGLPDWSEKAWKRRCGYELRKIVKHYLWRADFKGAKESLARMTGMIGVTGEVKKLRRRYLKYRLLSLIGYPIRKDRWADEQAG